MKRRSLARLALAGLLALGGANAIAQQDYPSRTVRIVAPLAPGGAVDILARILAERLSAQYGQPVIVENKPGASGHLGAQFAIRPAQLHHQRHLSEGVCRAGQAWVVTADGRFHAIQHAFL